MFAFFMIVLVVVSVGAAADQTKNPKLRAQYHACMAFLTQTPNRLCDTVILLYDKLASGKYETEGKGVRKLTKRHGDDVDPKKLLFDIDDCCSRPCSMEELLDFCL